MPGALHLAEQGDAQRAVDLQRQPKHHARDGELAAIEVGHLLAEIDAVLAGDDGEHPRHPDSVPKQPLHRQVEVVSLGGSHPRRDELVNPFGAGRRAVAGEAQVVDLGPADALADAEDRVGFAELDGADDVERQLGVGLPCHPEEPLELTEAEVLAGSLPLNVHFAPRGAHRQDRTR